MPQVTTRARLLARAEMLYLRVATRAAVRQLILLVVALAFACLALVMLTVSAFLALSDLYGPVYGALFTGLALLFISFLVLVGASRAGGGREQRLALELREIARQEMAAEISSTGSWAKQALASSGIAALVLQPLLGRIFRSKRSKRRSSEG